MEIINAWLIKGKNSENLCFLNEELNEEKRLIKFEDIYFLDDIDDT